VRVFVTIESGGTIPQKGKKGNKKRNRGGQHRWFHNAHLKVTERGEQGGGVCARPLKKGWRGLGRRPFNVARHEGKGGRRNSN